MQNQKIKRDCGRARNAQVRPRSAQEPFFVQKNLAQPPNDKYYIILFCMYYMCLY